MTALVVGVPLVVEYVQPASVVAPAHVLTYAASAQEHFQQMEQSIGAQLKYCFQILDELGLLKNRVALGSQSIQTGVRQARRRKPCKGGQPDIGTQRTPVTASFLVGQEWSPGACEIVFCPFWVSPVCSLRAARTAHRRSSRIGRSRNADRRVSCVAYVSGFLPVLFCDFRRSAMPREWDDKHRSAKKLNGGLGVVLWPVCTHTIPFRMLWCP